MDERKQYKEIHWTIMTEIKEMKGQLMSDTREELRTMQSTSEIYTKKLTAGINKF